MSKFAAMKNTSEQFDKIISVCRELFINKTKDYGTAWRILRLPSLTDQIFIKVQRIRNLQEKSERKVDEDESSEFIGIINYCLMALIQLDKGVGKYPDFTYEEAVRYYDEKVLLTKKLMENKNHDYDEVWRDMRVSSITDLILMKIFRLKSMEDSNDKLVASEGRDANYQDMLNYSVFALILLNFNHKDS